MFDAPKIGQVVRLNRPKSLDHGHVFEVVAVHPSGKLADIVLRPDGLWVDSRDRDGSGWGAFATPEELARELVRHASTGPADDDASYGRISAR